MGHLWLPDISVWEKILRTAVVYLFILAAFRFTGKRQVGQLTPFDLVVLLLISNVVQNAVIGADNSLGGGLLGAATILALNFLVVEASFRFKSARRFLEGKPVLLVHNGRVIHDNLNHERITLEELQGALRRSGLAEVDQVRYAVLEENGQISVVPKQEKDKER